MDDKLREEFEAAISPHFVMQNPPFNFRTPNGSYFYARMNLAWVAYQLRAPRYSIVDRDGTVLCQCADEGWAISIQELLDSNHLTVTKIVEGAAEPRTLRAALEYTNVLLAKLPPPEEITYRLNANKAVLSETKN